MAGDRRRVADGARRAPLYIGGQLVEPATGRHADHFDPTTERPTGSYAVAGASDVDQAVGAGRAALASYRGWSGERRARLLREIGAALRARADEIADLMTLECGLTRGATAPVGDIAAGWFECYAGWAERLSGTMRTHAAGFGYTLAEPLGVVAALASWNGGIAAIGMKCAPALAAGCPVVVKSPEVTPFSTLLFAEICEEIGVPAGLVNIVSGDAATGSALVGHPGVDMVTFTGGTAVGSQIQATAAANVTPVLLELGGKSANIVFADADLARAVTASAAGIIVRCGQSCVAPTRLLVQDAVYEQVVAQVVEVCERARLGDPYDPSVDMGPVASKAAFERITATIAAAQRRGDGELLTTTATERSVGCFVRPTVFGDIDPASDVAREEIFGPVLAISRFATDDEAIAIANDSPYGLAAYVHTENLDRAHRMARALDVGNVSVNGAPAMAGPWAPFGGARRSGHGREGGLEGLMEFVNLRHVNVALAAESG